MAFEKTAKGTYGQGMPSFAKPVMKLVNPVMLWQARRSKTTGGMNLLVLNTVGAKTGQPRQTVLGYFPGPGSPDSWLIIASAAGSASNPAWYHNIAAHPDQVSIELGGQKVAVTVAQLSGPEREAAWAQISASPRYAAYATKTDRVIPIIRLTRAG
jgi:deazaflavin-dependent oxidoreductase (nitroreductase family)